MIRELLSHRRRGGRSSGASERYALTMLGYAFGCRRSIVVAPVRPPVSVVNDARPLGLEPVGTRDEQVFERVEFTR